MRIVRCTSDLFSPHADGPEQPLLLGYLIIFKITRVLLIPNNTGYHSLIVGQLFKKSLAHCPILETTRTVRFQGSMRAYLAVLYYSESVIYSYCIL